ncbi:MAG: PAS domain S-box protein, partial [Candidatus Competibacter sp.]|nr:PAS domain S-box protein [Candidatus Competibacter sp.]
MPTGTEVAQLESGLPHMESEAMLVVDPAGRIVRANALAECLFDYPPGTLAGQSLTILIPARLRDSHQLHVAKYFGNPHPRLMGASMSLWGLRRDGSEFAAEISLNPLSVPEGLHVLAAIHDVSDYRRIQQTLERATVELERQVAARNAELLQANAELRQQIAERAQAEAALREAEAQYRQLVENQPDLICRFLPDTTLTFVNAAYAGFFARQPEELIGQRFIEFLSAEQRAEVWEQLAAFTPAAPARQYEHQTLRADGVARWHLWHDFALFDDRGKVTGFQSVGVDITERKRAEEVLLKESQFRRAIIERAAEGLCVCHNIPEFPYVRFTVWNPRMEEITRYTMEEINRWGWYQSLYPDAEVREHAQARMARMRQGDDLMGEEWEITRATGEKRMVSISTSVVEDVADSVHVLALIHDTTERKRAEEALFEAKERAQVTLHSIGDAVITTDARGMVDYLNPVAEALAGWTTAEAQGRPLSEVFQIVNEQTRQPAPD